MSCVNPHMSFTEAGGQLIARHVAFHRQEGGRPWSFHAHANAHTSLRYALKVTCAAQRHGRACSEVGHNVGVCGVAVDPAAAVAAAAVRGRGCRCRGTARGEGLTLQCEGVVH